MDIILAEKLKLHMRVARGWLLRKIKKEHNLTIDDIIYDLEHTGNRAVRKIWNSVKTRADQCIMGHQRKETKLWSAIMLWILTKDTAYRDLFFTIAKDLLDMKDEIYDTISELAKDPEHWYPNAHQTSQQRSKEKEEAGELLEQGRAYDETILVPAIQKPKISKVEKGREVEPVDIYIEK